MMRMSEHPSEVQPMSDNRKTASAVVTEAAAQAMLRGGRTRELASDEEKVMRMRLGASLPRAGRLERVGRGFSDTEIELLAYEIEAYLVMKERRRRGAARPAAAAPSRTKEKIVRALRKKT
jgi:hypothetical protein